MVADSFLFLFDRLFTLFVSLFSSQGIAILCLSVVISLVLNILQKTVNTGLGQFNLKYADLFGSLDEVQHVKNGIERHFYTKELYKIHGYKNFYKLFDVIPVLIQIPFFIAAYVYLVGHPSLENESFLFIKNLSSPDGLYYNINLLPLFMTIINLLSGIVYSKNENRKSIQFIIVPLVFLFFLYDKPSSILLYWTSSNIISLALNLFRGRRNIRIPRFHLHFNPLSILAASNVFLLISMVYWIFNRRVLSGSLSVSLAINLSDWLVIFNSILILSVVFQKRPAVKKSSYLVYSLLFAGMMFMFVQLKGFCIFDFCKLSTLKKQALFFCLYSVHFLLYLYHQGRQLRGSNKYFKGSRLIHFIPALIVPLYYVILNPGYFSLSSSVAFVVLVSALPVSLYLLFSLLFKGQLKTEYLVILCIILPVVTFLMPLINQLVGVRAEENFFNLILFLLLTFLISLYITKTLSVNYILSLLSLIILVNIGFSFFASETKPSPPVSIDQTSLEKSLFEDDHPVLSDLPDIYFLIYDAYADPDMMDYYGIDNQEHFEYLKSKDFRFYEDVYTLNPASLGSISKTLNMTDRSYTDRESREIISGNSRVDNYLQSLGYHTNYVLKEYYVMGNHEFDGDYIFPERLDRSRYMTRMKSIFASIVMGEFKFDEEVKLGSFSRDEWIAKKREIMKISDTPTFLYTHTGPGHSQNSGQCLATEIDDYSRRLIKANQEMKEDIDTILKYNRNSIIILAGDHGPYLNGDCSSLRNYSSDEITGALIRDRFGMFLSIRWPEQSRSVDYDISVLQELFIPVLSYVNDDDTLLEYNLTNSGTDQYFTLPQNLIQSGLYGLGRDRGRSIGSAME